MKRLLLSAAMAGTLFASLAGSAFAGSDNHVTPGTPGTPNCVGQTMAYLAQLGPRADAPGGIGNLPDLTGLSVKEIKAIAEEYCAG